MRKLLLVAIFCLAGCDLDRSPSAGASVTVKLPPPKAAPAPGFTVAPATDRN